MILTVAALKGGSSRTTTSAFLAHALAEQGRRVLVVDADEQASISRWAELADWKIPVVGMPSGRLHVPGSGVDGIRGDHDAVVIDTPPSVRLQGVVESAIRAATHIVVPVAPTSAEVERMAVLRTMVDDLSHLGRHGAPPTAVALFTRTVPHATSTGAYRELLADEGWAVLRAQVARLERFGQAFGGAITGATETAYGDALAELLAVKP